MTWNSSEWVNYWTFFIFFALVKQNQSWDSKIMVKYQVYKVLVTLIFTVLYLFKEFWRSHLPKFLFSPWSKLQYLLLQIGKNWNLANFGSVEHTKKSEILDPHLVKFDCLCFCRGISKLSLKKIIKKSRQIDSSMPNSDFCSVQQEASPVLRISLKM